jgi:hypothetical protein
MSGIRIAAGGASAPAVTVRAKASGTSSQLKLFHELLVKIGFEYIKDSFLTFCGVIGG